MAYWVRKESTFDGCETGTAYDIALMEDDTAGVTSEFAALVVGGPPFTTEVLKTGDPRKPWGLRRTSAVLNVTDEVALMQDIRDADDEKYRLRLRLSGSGSNIYTLKVRTREVEREIFHGPTQAIVATDGLDQLESLPWTPSPGRMSVAALVRECLGQVGFGIGFRFSSDWYPTSALVATDDPLNVGKRIDRLVLYDDLRASDTDEVMYSEVLDYLCANYQLLVGLDDNTDGDRWRIIQRLENFEASGRYYWDYDSAGSLTGSGNETTHVRTYDDGDFKQKGAALEAPSLPALKRSRYVYHHDALSGNLEPSQGFSLWSGGRPVGHTAVGSPTVSHVGLFGDTHAIRIHEVLFGSKDAQTAADSVVRYLYYQTDDVVAVSGVDTVEFAVTAATFPVDPIPLGRRWYHGSVKIATVGVSPVQYMDADGNWSTEEHAIPIPVIIQDGRAELTSKVFSTSSVPAGTYAFLVTYGQLVDGYNSPSLVGGIWYGRVEPIFKPNGDREATETAIVSTVDASNTTQVIEERFVYGQGPVDSSTPGRMTYLVATVETDAKNFVRGDGAAGGGIEFGRFWNYQVLRQFRVAVLDYDRTFVSLGGSVPGAWDVVLDGSTRFDSFYRYTRSWAEDEAGGNWVEIRSDSPSVSHVDLTRDWDGIEPTDDGSDPVDGELPPSEGFTIPSCIDLTSATAVYPCVSNGVDATLWNATGTSGAMTPDGDNFAFSSAGVQKTSSSDYVDAVDVEVMGPLPVRMSFTFMWRRDSAALETLMNFLAGTAGGYKIEILTTGVVRYTVTSNDGTPLEIDSDVLVGVGDYVVVEGTVDVLSGDLSLMIRLKSGARRRYAATHGSALANDLYDLRLMPSGGGTARFILLQGNGTLRNLSQFNQLATCLAGYAESEGVTTFNGNYDALLVYSATYLRLYDENGNLLEDITHGRTPPGIGLRPTLVPTTDEWAITDGTKAYTLGRSASLPFVERFDFGGTKLARVLVWDDFRQRLWYGTADAAGTADGELGYFENLDGTWSKVVVSTDYPILDLSVSAARLWALVGDGIWGAVVEIREDGSEVDRVSLDSPWAVGQSLSLESFYYVRRLPASDPDDPLGARVERVEPVIMGGEGIDAPVYTILSGEDVTVLERCGLSIHNSRIRGFVVGTIGAGDRILRFDADEINQTPASSTVSAIVDVDGDPVRGIALVKVGISPPAAPSALEVTADGTDAFDLAWTDNSTTELGFFIQEQVGASWITVGSVPSGTTAANIDGYDPEETVCFRVVAYNSGGSSEASNTDCATTEAEPAFPVFNVAVMRRVSDIAIVPLDGSTPIVYDDGSANRGSAMPVNPGVPAVVDYENNLIVYEADDRYIYKMGLDGSSPTQVWDAGSDAWYIGGLYSDPLTGLVWVTYWKTSGGFEGRVGYFTDRDTGAWTFNQVVSGGTTYRITQSMVIDSVGDMMAAIYVTNESALYSPISTLATIATRAGTFAGITLDSIGERIFLLQSSNVIRRAYADLLSGGAGDETVINFSEGSPPKCGIDYAPSEDVLVVGTAFRLVKIPASGTDQGEGDWTVIQNSSAYGDHPFRLAYIDLEAL